MEYYLYRVTPEGRRILRAKFLGADSDYEAIIITNRLNEVSACNYILEPYSPPPPRTNKQQHLLASLQIDITQTTPTRRYITYTLSRSTPAAQPNKHQYLAVSRRNGAVRGIVEANEDGLHLFLSRLRTVWPNSEAV